MSAIEEGSVEGRVVTASATVRPIGAVQDLVESVSGEPSERFLRGRLAAKISSVYGDITRVEKSGINVDQGYPFATADDVYDEIRASMSRNGIAILPRMGIPSERQGGKGGNGRHVTMPMRYDVIDVETGYCESIDWIGEVTEYSDKALTKAVTSATKYFLRTLFLASTGIADDPDTSSPPVAAQAVRPRQERQPAPEPPDESSEPAEMPPAALRAILNTKVYEPFRGICSQKGLDPGKIAQDAWREGARTKTELIYYVTSIPGELNEESQEAVDAPASDQQIGQIFELIAEVKWVDPNGKSGKLVYDALNATLDMNIESLALLESEQANAIIGFLSDYKAGTQPLADGVVSPIAPARNSSKSRNQG